ncbi:MAG TPA: type II CAAX endopeptidase family protein [Edaphocola sp.]|nr:type II CAAX endopeptidase family protein [Edaphocola sp.]
MTRNPVFQLQKMSYGIQFVFFLFLFFLGNSLLLLLTLIGKNFSEIGNLALMMTGTQLLSFLLPAVLFILLIPREPIPFLHFKAIKKTLDLSWIAVLAVALILFVSTTSQFIQYLPLGNMADQLQGQRESMEKLALKMDGIGDLVIRLVMMAVLPAIGEEIFFRGVLQRFVHTFLKNAIGAAVLTSIIFALFHGSIYNIVPLIIAGTVLGLVYYYSGNIWYNIILHFIVNGSQVAIIYFAGADKDISKSGLPLSIAIPGFILSGLIVWIMINKFKRENISLGQNWIMPRSDG